MARVRISNDSENFWVFRTETLKPVFESSEKSIFRLPSIERRDRNWTMRHLFEEKKNLSVFLGKDHYAPCHVNDLLLVHDKKKQTHSFYANVSWWYNDTELRNVDRRVCRLYNSIHGSIEEHDTLFLSDKTDVIPLASLDLRMANEKGQAYFQCGGAFRFSSVGSTRVEDLKIVDHPFLIDSSEECSEKIDTLVGALS
ncbi:MAG: hypothetical protein ACI9S8_001997 [Chlamydiales bacterium]|jgi:hypothetical protein